MYPEDWTKSVDKMKGPRHKSFRTFIIRITDTKLVVPASSVRRKLSCNEL